MDSAISSGPFQRARYTLTTNPAIICERPIREFLSYTHVNRTTDAVYQTTGSGRVSFTLAHYGVDPTILGFWPASRGQLAIVEASKVLGQACVETASHPHVFCYTKGGLKFPNTGAPVIRSKQDEMLESCCCARL